MPSTITFERRSAIPVPAAQLFAWHLRPGAFERLQAPGDGTQVLERTGRIEDDTMRVVVSVQALGPIRQQLHVRHEGFVPDTQFVDVMERGPFRSWRHTHRAEATGATTSELIDTIEYALPMGPLGRLVGRPFVERMLRGMFDHRHAVTRGDLTAHRAAGLEPMLVRVTGSDEDQVRQVAAMLLTGGHDVQGDAQILGYESPAGDPDASVVATAGAATITRHDRTRDVVLVGDARIDPLTVLAAIAELA